MSPSSQSQSYSSDAQVRGLFLQALSSGPLALNSRWFSNSQVLGVRTLAALRDSSSNFSFQFLTCGSSSSSLLPAISVSSLNSLQLCWVLFVCLLFFCNAGLNGSVHARQALCSLSYIRPLSYFIIMYILLYLLSL
jgi:hypothetical protein